MLLAVVDPEEINSHGIVAALRFAIQDGKTSGSSDAVVVAMAEGSTGAVHSPWLVVIEESTFGGVCSQRAAAILESS